MSATETIVAQFLDAGGAVHNVKHPAYGAVGDGVADDTAALQAALDAAETAGGGIVYFPVGDYLTTAELQVASKVGLQGAGSWGGPDGGSRIVGAHTGRSVVSLVGSLYVRMSNLSIVGDETTTPQVGLLLGRATSASSARHHFSGIQVSGYFTHAACYNVASEENTWVACDFTVLGGGAVAAYYTSQSDSLVLGGLTGSSNIHQWFFDCNFWHYDAGAGDCGIYIDAGASTGHLHFMGGYTAIASGADAYVIIRTGTVDGLSCLGPIEFSGFGGEPFDGGVGPDDAFLLTGTPVTLSFLKIRDVGLTSAVYFVHCVASQTELHEADIRGTSSVNRPSLFNQVASSSIDVPTNVTFAGNAFGNRVQSGGTVTFGALNANNEVRVPGSHSLGAWSYNGEAIEDTDFTLSAGWGTTASAFAITGNSQRCRFSIGATGTGQAANPTITLTFKADAGWASAPMAIVQRNGGAQYTAALSWTVSTTALVITVTGTPVADEIFNFEVLIIGAA